MPPIQRLMPLASTKSASQLLAEAREQDVLLPGRRFLCRLAFDGRDDQAHKKTDSAAAREGRRRRCRGA